MKCIFKEQHSWSIVKSVTQAGVRLFEAQCFCFGVYQYADAEKHLIL